MQSFQYAAYVPGAIGRVAEMHARYYHQNWGFGLFFEAKVAGELSAFLSRFDPERDFFRTILIGGQVEGSITMDGVHAKDQGAHLRWFITSDLLRGKGAGNALMEQALSFCREKRYGSVYLWTFEGLLPARHLYEKHGFRLAEEHPGLQWGTRVKEQKFVLAL